MNFFLHEKFLPPNTYEAILIIPPIFYKLSAPAASFKGYKVNSLVRANWTIFVRENRMKAPDRGVRKRIEGPERMYTSDHM